MGICDCNRDGRRYCILDDGICIIKITGHESLVDTAYLRPPTIVAGCVTNAPCWLSMTWRKKHDGRISDRFN